MSLLLKKIDRVVVWILLIFFLVFMISGYMITKGFIHRYYGLILHTQLDLPIMLLFTIHITINIKYILARWGIRDRKISNILPLSIGIFFFVIILYLDQFFSL